MTNGKLSVDDYHDHVRHLQNESSLRRVANELFQVIGRKVEFPGLGFLQVVELREASLKGFPFIRYLGYDVARSSGRKTKIKCFVGHRFVPGIQKSIRFNLRHLFEPYGIELCWSGYDLTSADLFREIIRLIRTSHMCIFDNLGTLNRPNVYIEAGIAYVLDRPMIFCECEGSGRIRAPLDSGSVPSDLQHILTLRYRNYEDLCRQLYFNIPVFLERHKLI
jgi:hypothetical protein